MSNTILDEAVRNAQHQFLDQPVGIWIDAHEAHVIRLLQDGHQAQRITVNKARHKAILKAKHHGSRTPMHVATDERHELGKLQHERQVYLERVLNVIGEAQRIVVFGPAGVKHELQQALEHDSRWRGTKVSALPADRMTPNQRVAWVKRFFR
jgi:hypothetical protein